MYNLPRIKMEKSDRPPRVLPLSGLRHYQINISASWTFNLLVACNEQGTSAWFAVIGESFHYAIETWCTSFTMIPSSVMFTGLGIEKQPLNTWTELIAIVVNAILKEKLYWEKYRYFNCLPDGHNYSETSVLYRSCIWNKSDVSESVAQKVWKSLD